MAETRLAVVERFKRAAGWITGHPFISGGAIVAGIVLALGGYGGGYLRSGVLSGDINHWFSHLQGKGYKPAWIIPEYNFRVVIVEPIKLALLSIAPIVGTYDFYGLWKAPITMFKESAPPRKEE